MIQILYCPFLGFPTSTKDRDKLRESPMFHIFSVLLLWRLWRLRELSWLPRRQLLLAGREEGSELAGAVPGPTVSVVPAAEERLPGHCQLGSQQQQQRRQQQQL